MKTVEQHIENAIVEQHSDYRWCMQADYKGDRYHVWCDENLVEVSPLYKNAMPGLPGYTTRKLNLSSHFARRLVAEIKRRARAEDLTTKAREAFKQQQAEEEAEAAAARAELQKERAGVELFDALLDVRACLLNWMEIADDEDKRDYDQRAIDKAEAALRNAGWTP